MSVPDTRKARPAPAVNGAGLGRDADGSRAVGDRTPDRHLQRPDRPPRFRRPPPKVSGPPSTDSSAVSPSPCRFRRAPPVTSAGTSRRTAVNLAAGTGCRMCHRSPPAGDLRHRPGVRRAGRARRGVRSRMVSGWSSMKPRLRNAPRATPGAGPSRGRRAGSGSPPVDREPDAGRLEGGQVAGGSSTCRYTTPLVLVRGGRSSS
jgi:hypothetical protein